MLSTNETQRLAAAKQRRIFEGICLFPALRVCLFSHLVRCSEVEIVRNTVTAARPNYCAQNANVNANVTVPLKVHALHRLQHMCAHSLLCAAFAEAEDAIKGPIPKVRNTPIGPASQIPLLDTKLLVTSKVLLSESVLAADAYTILLKQSPGQPRGRHSPAHWLSRAHAKPPFAFINI